MLETSLSRRQLALRLAGPAAASFLGPRTLAGEPAALPPAGSLTDVGGIRVGHFTDPRRPTGCTAILFDAPVIAAADYDGSAPGESLGVMLQPVSPLERIHAILLTGGGPMGLGATGGVVRFLDERKVGYDWGVPNVRVPIVVGAVIDDLALGDGRVRFGPDEAYKACEAASDRPLRRGQRGGGGRGHGREDAGGARHARDEGRHRHRCRCASARW